MTFGEFYSWCRDRAEDGKWGAHEAMICLTVCGDIDKHRLFQERRWRQHPCRELAEEIVSDTNDMIRRMDAEGAK